jgi:hypothetical protein
LSDGDPAAIANWIGIEAGASGALADQLNDIPEGIVRVRRQSTPGRLALAEPEVL